MPNYYECNALRIDLSLFFYYMIASKTPTNNCNIVLLIDRMTTISLQLYALTLMVATMKTFQDI